VVHLDWLKATPLSVSLNTLSLSRSETIDEPRSVMLSVRHKCSFRLADDADEMLLCGLSELGDEDLLRDLTVLGAG